MAGPRSKDTRDEVEVRPLSVTPATAARMLNVHYETVRDLITRGVFTVLAPKGRGPGKRVFIPTAEVEVYGETRDELAVQDYRQRRERAGPRRTPK